MNSKLLSKIEGRREWVVIFDAGDEVMAGLKAFTLELIVFESPAHLRKSFRPEFGLALIDLQQ